MRNGGRPSAVVTGSGEPVMIRPPASRVHPWLSLEISSACEASGVAGKVSGRLAIEVGVSIRQ